MSRSEFDNGIPRRHIERINYEALQNRYGNFAIIVLNGIRQIDPNSPD